MILLSTLHRYERVLVIVTCLAMTTTDLQAQQQVAPPPMAWREDRSGVFPSDSRYRMMRVDADSGDALRVFTTEPPPDDRALVLVVQGSNCRSLFAKGRNRAAPNWFDLLRQELGDSAQIIVVEKPGVTLFDQTSRGETCSEAFRAAQGTRWLESLERALRTALAMRARAPRAVVVVGHSEGASLAPWIALQVPAVTHTAVLAGSPAPLIADGIQLAQSETAAAPDSASENVAIALALDEWAATMRDPDQADFRSGQSFRFYAQAYRPFDYQAYAARSVRTFVAVASMDRSSSHRVGDHFAVELLTRGADVTWFRVLGGDHGFGTLTVPDGMAVVLRQVARWVRGVAAPAPGYVWPPALRRSSPDPSPPARHR